MGEIVKTKYADSEVSKVQDFAHTADSPVEILNAVLEGAFDDVVNSFVVSGLVVRQLSTPSMNVELSPGLAFDRASDKLIHLASAISVPVTAAHATLDRIDTVEVRYKETGFDSETRAFKDPVNGTVSFAAVETKTKVSLEARCLAGSPGAGAAPATESGWVKLSEVFVGAAAGAIFNANIRNMTAGKDAADNAAWTVEKQKTFHLGSIESIKDLILSHSAEVATQAAAVHGIQQGHANGFDADTLDGHHPGDGNGLNSDSVDGLHGADIALKEEVEAITDQTLKTTDSPTFAWLNTSGRIFPSYKGNAAQYVDYALASSGNQIMPAGFVMVYGRAGTGRTECFGERYDGSSWQEMWHMTLVGGMTTYFFPVGFVVSDGANVRIRVNNSGVTLRCYVF